MGLDPQPISTGTAGFQVRMPSHNACGSCCACLLCHRGTQAISNAIHSAGPESCPRDTMVAARPEQLYTHTTEPRAVGQRKSKVSNRGVALRLRAAGVLLSAALVEQWAAGNEHGTPDWLCLLDSFCSRSLR